MATCHTPDVPELPEVETIRRQLEPLLVGATVCDAWAFPSGKFTPAVEATGATIVSVGRRPIGAPKSASAQV